MADLDPIESDEQVPTLYTLIVTKLTPGRPPDIRILANTTKELQMRSELERYTKEFLDSPRESPWGKTLGEQKRGLEFGVEEYNQIDAYCRSLDMPWFASAWDIPALEFLKQYDCPYNKIASAMVTNLELVKAVAKEMKPNFISTAMCDWVDMDRALNELDRKLVTLMHCVGTYPAPEEDLNLLMIDRLRGFYHLPVGYSGHEASVSPSVIAVVLGAVAIERHLTLDRSMYGSDQAASVEPAGFRQLVGAVRKIEKAIGDGNRSISHKEIPIAKKLRAHIPFGSNQ